MTPSPKVPEAMVEIAARALFEASAHESDLPYVWDGKGVLLDDEVKDAYRETATKILVAALPAIHQEVREKLQPHLDAIYEIGSIPDTDEVGAPQDIDGPALWRAVDALQRDLTALSLPCERCGGSEFVDSGDPNLPIKPCPDCGTGEKQPEPDPEPFADIAPLTATWGNGGQLQALTVKTPEGIVRLVPEQPEPDSADCECGHGLEEHRSRSSNCEAPGCECELYEPHQPEPGEGEQR